MAYHINRRIYIMESIQVVKNAFKTENLLICIGLFSNIAIS